jgi:hypothetical protein
MKNPFQFFIRHSLFVIHTARDSLFLLIYFIITYMQQFNVRNFINSRPYRYLCLNPGTAYIFLRSASGNITCGKQPVYCCPSFSINPIASLTVPSD